MGTVRREELRKDVTFSVKNPIFDTEL